MRWMLFAPQGEERDGDALDPVDDLVAEEERRARLREQGEQVI